ncbi:RidA family protein [Dichelobacter nodosus]|uniref:Endoribonuclease L-PSP n=1 Tax=Dichelobacter nodosus (strain VCS1703A) TaxID=246195 RepID=A5EXW6_DICNV|nr:RidA family protein [Dichelobacter nodosus]ABQ13645.1 endoribonuclease L-PSP [Dichelobacter nodosus VCS1703A]AXM45802.1 RidA family protein [Dichelobacter nodosus]KNZ39251.1 endoribonuclease [Dichelobacter nodosus]TGA64436.1 RidA family protein [Dichelobacter nodosus]
MTKTVIHSDNAPKAIGPYSQAIRAGNLIYTSGQIPLDPKTGAIVAGDFKAQAKQVFENLKAVCAAAGTDFSKVVKVNVFISDMNNFAVFNDMMASYFSAPYPARSAVEVSRLPKDAMVEVELVLVVD